SCASPFTNGSRRKLVTSSRASVRAALNDANERTAKSSGVWHAGLRSKIFAATPASPTPPRKVPMIAAYASYGGLSRRARVSVATAIEATLDRVPAFKTSDAYRPTGDQPTAIATLAESLRGGEKFQTLVGATGTGKTATMAWTIEQVGKPAL